jgi:hypothetical protein
MDIHNSDRHDRHAFRRPIDETKFIYAQPFTFREDDSLLNGNNSDIVKQLHPLLFSSQNQENKGKFTNHPTAF